MARSKKYFQFASRNKIRRYAAIIAACAIPFSIGLFLIITILSAPPFESVPDKPHISSIDTKRHQLIGYKDFLGLSLGLGVGIQFILSIIVGIIWFFIDMSWLSLVLLIILVPISIPFIFLSITLPICLVMMLFYRSIALHRTSNSMRENRPDSLWDIA